VRGLDYYRHTAFEFITDQLGAQGTVLAGGRYDGLIESIGGSHTPAVGWAAGIERLAMMLNGPLSHADPVIAVVPDRAELRPQAHALAYKLRNLGVQVLTYYAGKGDKQADRARREGADGVLFVRADGLHMSRSPDGRFTGEQLDLQILRLPGVSAIDGDILRHSDA